jgi:hypothetical protein
MGSIPEMPAWPANETETLLEAACRDRARREACLRSLLSSELIVLPNPEAPLPHAPGEVTVSEPTSFQLRTIATDAGEAIIALTSEALMALSVPPGTPFIAMRGEDLFRAAGEMSVAINPMGPYGKALIGTEIRALLAGLVLQEDGPVRVGEGTRVRFAPVVEPSPTLLAPLRQACEGCPDVREGFLGLVNYPDVGADYSLLIGLVCSGGFTEAARVVGGVAKGFPHLPGGAVDVVDVSDAAPNGELPVLVRKRGLRFYKRPLLKRWLG